MLAEGGNEALLGRLSPIFDLGLFADPGDASLGDLLDGQVVIRLSQLPGDEVKNSVAEFFLMALYNYLIRLEQPRADRLLVLDEAWRVTNSERLEPLMRERPCLRPGRHRRHPVPQRPDRSGLRRDRDPALLQSVAGRPDQIDPATLVGKTSGTEAERVATEMRSMRELHCLMQNQQYRPYRRVAVTPYWQRVE